MVGFATQGSPQHRPTPKKHWTALGFTSLLKMGQIWCQQTLGQPIRWFHLLMIPLTFGIFSLSSLAARAQTTPLSSQQVQDTLDNIWVLVAAILVIFMNAGFAMLETGLCRRKNAVNLLMKNLIVFALATLSFWAIGFALMYGRGRGFFLSGTPETYGVPSNLTLPVFFLFQLAFAGTAATIVSGAVAERIKFINFIIFSLLLTGIVYPISGQWVWGGGFLSNLSFLGVDDAGVPYSFIDFAGSTVVHSVGGWAALIGAILLGPRQGKYREDGLPLALPGHNIAISTLGGLILWIGWFGFNPGSVLAATPQVAQVMLVTNLAAAAGGVASLIVSWIVTEKPDLSMIINGILAGLVSITAGCGNVRPLDSILIGAIAGSLVVLSVIFIDSVLRIDDPVGALSVHLVNGIWGTLAVGFFDQETGLLYSGQVNQLLAQFVGIGVIGIFTIVMSLIFWGSIWQFLGLRVSSEEEILGLDLGEHGMEAYNGFLKDK